MTFSAFQPCVVLILGILWAQEAVGQNTSIQDEPTFIGWYINPTTIEQLLDPLTWQTSGTYAVGCSDTAKCTYATNCESNSITYDNGATSTCNQCRTMTIYETSPFGSPTASNLFCAAAWSAATAYRKFPETPTTSSDSSTSSATDNTDTTHATGSPKSASETDGPAATTSESKPSQAWIAGAVIGPLAGVAIIAGVVAWLMARRKRKQSLLSQQQAPGYWQQQPPAPMYFVPQHPPQELDTGKGPQELDTGKLPHELDAGRYSR